MVHILLSVVFVCFFIIEYVVYHTILFIKTRNKLKKIHFTNLSIWRLFFKTIDFAIYCTMYTVHCTAYIVLSTYRDVQCISRYVLWLIDLMNHSPNAIGYISLNLNTIW